jgi:hypothetical protein
MSTVCPLDVIIMIIIRHLKSWRLEWPPMVKHTKFVEISTILLQRFSYIFRSSQNPALINKDYEIRRCLSSEYFDYNRVECDALYFGTND